MTAERPAGAARAKGPAPWRPRWTLWPMFLAFYPGYDFFQQLAKDRKIPIVILDPR